MDFKSSVERLKDTLRKVKVHGADSSSDNLLDFKERRKDSYNKVIVSCLSAIKENDFGELVSFNKNNKEKVLEINEYVKDLDILLNNSKIDELIVNLDKILKVYSLLSIPEVKGFEMNFSRIPVDIVDEIKADFIELERCFNSKLYRSAVILCGRVLEIALHRKYYEVSGVDALEKSPGIGLGKLIAKLIEREVKFDPGLTQQIHLINQVRIGSVHKKKEVFNPSLEQTQAMILYTIDVVNKLF